MLKIILAWFKIASGMMSRAMEIRAAGMALVPGWDNVQKEAGEATIDPGALRAACESFEKDIRHFYEVLTGKAMG